MSFHWAKRSRIPNIQFLILSSIWTFLMHILSFVDMHHIRSNINPIYIMKIIYCTRILATFWFLSCLCSVNVLRLKIPRIPKYQFLDSHQNMVHILSFVDVHHIRWNITPIYIMKTIYCIRIWATFSLLSCLCSVNVLRAKIPESLNISFWILSRIWTSLMHILSFVDTHHIRWNINPIYIIKTIYRTRIRATFFTLVMYVFCKCP